MSKNKKSEHLKSKNLENLNELIRQYKNQFRRKVDMKLSVLSNKNEHKLNNYKIVVLEHEIEKNQRLLKIHSDSLNYREQKLSRSNLDIQQIKKEALNSKKEITKALDKPVHDYKTQYNRIMDIKSKIKSHVSDYKIYKKKLINTEHEIQKNQKLLKTFKDHLDYKEGILLRLNVNVEKIKFDVLEQMKKDQLEEEIKENEMFGGPRVSLFNDSPPVKLKINEINKSPIKPFSLDDLTKEEIEESNKFYAKPHKDEPYIDLALYEIMKQQEIQTLIKESTKWLEDDDIVLWGKITDKILELKRDPKLVYSKLTDKFIYLEKNKRRVNSKNRQIKQINIIQPQTNSSRNKPKRGIKKPKRKQKTTLNVKTDFPIRRLPKIFEWIMNEKINKNPQQFNRRFVPIKPKLSISPSPPTTDDDDEFVSIMKKNKKSNINIYRSRKPISIVKNYNINKFY